MEDRMARVERIVAQSAQLQASLQEAQTLMQINMRAIEANNRRIEETNRRIDTQLQESGELLQQLLQSVAVMQADIVRIDETHTP